MHGGMSDGLLRQPPNPRGAGAFCLRHALRGSHSCERFILVLLEQDALQNKSMYEMLIKTTMSASCCTSESALSAAAGPWAPVLLSSNNDDMIR